MVSLTLQLADLELRKFISDFKGQIALAANFLPGIQFQTLKFSLNSIELERLKRKTGNSGTLGEPLPS